tara:strand:+ start:2026 stop:2256 length:231 start_codon:yes stop_codon:yes gene_type:complete
MTIIKALQEVLSEKKEVVFETKDGTSIHITPEHAYSIVSVHDTLNQENQQTMRGMLEESEDKFIKVLQFCDKQFNK